MSVGTNKKKKKKTRGRVNQAELFMNITIIL